MGCGASSVEVPQEASAPPQDAQTARDQEHKEAHKVAEHVERLEREVASLRKGKQVNECVNERGKHASEKHCHRNGQRSTHPPSLKLELVLHIYRHKST